MITYERLWRVDPAAWRQAAAAWRGLVGLVDRFRAEVSETANRLRVGWSGLAASAADARLRDLTDEFAASRPAFIEVDQVLAEYAAELTRAKAMLEATVQAAETAGVRIDRDGRAYRDPAGPAVEGRVVGGISVAIRAALDRATVADQEAADRLVGLVAEIGNGWVTAPPLSRPPCGADPPQVRRWWDGLTSPQRRWLVAYEPALVGRLDGIPAAARDQANRLLLARQRAGPDATLAGLDHVVERLADDVPDRAYLLGLDPAGDGRVVVAVGDPDRADNVLTYVPGMTADLAGVAAELGRVDRMAGRCAELGPTERTSAVLWLDYDAPDFVDEAASDARARAAGPALSHFVEGLRVSHAGTTPAHHTVLGHSYGSLVVGATARDHGLDADDLVLVGSPGVGVDHASDLRLPPGRVWATTARDDIIQYGPLSPETLLGRVATSIALPVVGTTLAFGRPADDLWFGHNPADPGFGGRIFPGAPNGHTGYWDAGNSALDEMARITLGEHG